MHHLMGLVPPDQSRFVPWKASLRSAGVLRIAKQGRYPTTPLPISVTF
jgi:hypothetical protein